jgi:hypothetical protein
MYGNLVNMAISLFSASESSSQTPPNPGVKPTGAPRRATVPSSRNFWLFKRVVLAKYAPAAYAYRWAHLHLTLLKTITMMETYAKNVYCFVKP